MNMNVSPDQLIEMIRSGNNPQQLMMTMLQQMSGNNPMAASLLALAQQNNTKDISTFARNYFSSMGRDFDKEFNSFRQKTGF